MGKHQDIAGQKFGRLTAIRHIGGGKWQCKCECGGYSTPSISALRKGNSTTCGCGVLAARFKHGMASTPLHRTWIAMRSRCNNPNDPSYHNYGGRGIRACERWDDFRNFIQDMGMRPPGHDIDRIDNDKGYEPGNCRWVTRSQNLRNTRITKMLTYNGQTRSLRDWADLYGMPYETLRNRINRGWNTEQALTGVKFATMFRGMRKSKE